MTDRFSFLLASPELNCRYAQLPLLLFWRITLTWLLQCVIRRNSIRQKFSTITIAFVLENYVDVTVTMRNSIRQKFSKYGPRKVLSQLMHTVIRAYRMQHNWYAIYSISPVDKLNTSRELAAPLTSFTCEARETRSTATSEVLETVNTRGAMSASLRGAVVDFWEMRYQIVVGIWTCVLAP